MVALVAPLLFTKARTLTHKQAQMHKWRKKLRKIRKKNYKPKQQQLMPASATMMIALVSGKLAVLPFTVINMYAYFRCCCCWAIFCSVAAAIAGNCRIAIVTAAQLQAVCSCNNSQFVLLLLLSAQILPACRQAHTHIHPFSCICMCVNLT